MKKTTKVIKKKKKEKDLPVVLVKLGDPVKGWIPTHDHVMALAEMIEQMGLNKKFNFILYHYAIEMELLDKSKNLKDYGLQIIDQDKFEDFVKEAMGRIPTGTTFSALIKTWNEAAKNQDQEEPKKPEKTKLRKVKNTVG